LTTTNRTSTFVVVPPEERLCPRCQVALFEGTRNDATLLGCAKCGGVWLDNRACHALVQGSSGALVDLAERAARGVTTAPDERVAPCPVCSRPLTTTAVPPTTVTIDTCAAHGTWFDPNELRIVALAYAKLPGPLQFSPEAFEVPSERPGILGEQRPMFGSDDDGWLDLTFDIVATVLNAVAESSDSDDGGKN
jgi:Zn-finger nucleic acid-binding protein